MRGFLSGEQLLFLPRLPRGETHAGVVLLLSVPPSQLASPRGASMDADPDVSSGAMYQSACWVVVQGEATAEREICRIERKKKLR